MLISFQINSSAVPLVPPPPVIYGPDGRVMSAAPPGFIPGPPYGSETERVDICPYFSQGKCNNPTCPMLHPGIRYFTMKAYNAYMMRHIIYAHPHTHT